MGWHNWINLGSPLGRPVVGTPSIASWGPGRIDIFVRGADNRLYHRFWSGGNWSNWIDLDGVLTSSPAAISWGGDNYIDVYVRGSDNALYERWTYDGVNWSSWTRLGGVLSSGPAVASRARNRLDVFVVGTNRNIYTKVWDGSTWIDWVSLGDGAAFEVTPSAISRSVNEIELYAMGTDNIVKSKYWNGSTWSGWMNTRFSSVPALTSRPLDWADWYWIDPSQHLRSLTCRGSNFQNMSQCSESDGGYYGNASVATVNTRGENRIDMAMRFSDNNAWYNYWTP